MKHRRYIGGLSLFKICLLATVAALSIAAMILSGHVNLGQFYDVGEICDVICNDEGINTEGLIYDYEKNSYLVQENVAVKHYYIQSKENYWNYVYLKVKLKNVTDLKVTLEGYDSEWNQSFISDYILTEGDNYLTIGGHSLEQCKFVIEDQAGAEFAISKLRFYEKKIAVWGKKAWLCTGILWVYFVSVGIVFYRKKDVSSLKLLNGFIDIWQDIFCICGEKMYRSCSKFSSKQIRIFRVILFSVFIWGSYYFFITEIYLNNMNYVYLFGSVITILLAVFCFERKPVKLLWNENIVYLWVSVWGISIIADLIVGKANGEYLGVVMLGPVSFLFFAWRNMEFPEQLLKDLIDAIEICTWIRIVIVLLFDPYSPGVRYSGIDGNPGVFAMFLLTALIMFVSKIEKQTDQDKFQFCNLRYLAGIGIILQLFWHTQSVTGLATLLLLGILYSGRLHLQRRFVWKKKRSIRLWGSILIVLFVFLGTNKIMSRNMGSYPQDNTMTQENVDHVMGEWDLFSEPVYARSLITKTRIYNKLLYATSLESLTTGRNLYWTEFLRSMNLFGNENKPYFWRGRHLGHNAVLTMGNLYGVFIIVPYVMLLLTAVCMAAKKLRLQSSYGSVFIFGCLVGGIMTSMGDNVEQPFLLLLWITLYMCIGSLFPSREE